MTIPKNISQTEWLKYQGRRTHIEMGDYDFENSPAIECRFDRINEYLLRELKQSARIIDIGCRVGAIMRRVAEKGYHIQGFDVAPTAIYAAKQKGLDVFIGDMHNMPIKSNSFDAAIMTEVIEHCYNFTWICEIKRIMKRGALVYMEVPLEEPDKWTEDKEDPGHSICFRKYVHFDNFIDLYFPNRLKQVRVALKGTDKLFKAGVLVEV